MVLTLRQAKFMALEKNRVLPFLRARTVALATSSCFLCLWYLPQCQILPCTHCAQGQLTQKLQEHSLHIRDAACCFHVSTALILEENSLSISSKAGTLFSRALVSIVISIHAPSCLGVCLPRNGKVLYIQAKQANLD